MHRFTFFLTLDVKIYYTYTFLIFHISYPGIHKISTFVIFSHQMDINISFSHAWICIFTSMYIDMASLILQLMHGYTPTTLFSDFRELQIA